MTTDVALHIVAVQRDRQMAQRLRSGKYRVTHELNDEWVDIQNNGPYILNLQGRILAAVKRQGLINAPSGFTILRQVHIRANTTIPMHPGQKVRIFTGEQPSSATRLNDSRISRVLWLVQNTYIWVPEANEAHLYFTQADLRNGTPPLARYRLG